MSNAVFPSLPGLAWGVKRRMFFDQMEPQRAVSGREIRGSYQQYPMHGFFLPYEFLRTLAGTEELQTLFGFFMNRLGNFDSFLFTDPLDYAVTDAQFGTGNGSQTAFQLTRSFGAGGHTFAEPVQNVNALTNIKKAGVTQTVTTHYTVSSTGLVTFTSPPTAGQALTWTGTFYYRCRLLESSLEASSIWSGYWNAEGIGFVGAPGNRV